MFPLLFRDKRTRPDIKVMIILPQGTFRIVKENVFLSRIVLLVGFLKLCSMLNCEKIYIHGYITRIVKQIGINEKIFLIPRIICKGGNPVQRTHVLLPDFILPYCNYSVKTLCIVFSNEIPINTVEKISKEEWDKLVSIISRKSLNDKIEYIIRAKHKLKKRYKEIGSTHIFINKVQVPPKMLSIPIKIARFYYLLTSEKHRCINVQQYFSHTIYQFDTS